MKKKNLLFVAALQSILLLPAQQIYVNRVYQEDIGNPVLNPVLNPFGIQWSNSIVTATGYLYTVGHTNVNGEGENILLTKFDPDGNLIFSVTHNSSGTQNDYGTNLAEDSNGDIIICGTTHNGGLANFDIILLRYSSSGTKLDSVIYDSPSNLNDIPTCVKMSGSEIFVAATSENSTTSYDYRILKFTSNFNLGWTNTYDYAGLVEVPVGLDVSGGSDVSITGASASSANSWDYALALFDQTTGNYISDVRNNIAGQVLITPSVTRRTHRVIFT